MRTTVLYSLPPKNSLHEFAALRLPHAHALGRVQRLGDPQAVHFIHADAARFEHAVGVITPHARAATGFADAFQIFAVRGEDGDILQRAAIGHVEQTGAIHRYAGGITQVGGRQRSGFAIG